MGLIDFIFDNIFVVGVVVFGVMKVIGGMRKESKEREKGQHEPKAAPRQGQQPMVQPKPVRQRVVSQQTVAQKPIAVKPVSQQVITQKQVQMEDRLTKVRREVQQQLHRVVTQVPTTPARKFPQPKVLDRTYQHPMTSDEVAYATTESAAYDLSNKSRGAISQLESVTIRAKQSAGKETDIAVSMSLKATDLKQAFVLSEVLGRPRARQKRIRG